MAHKIDWISLTLPLDSIVSRDFDRDLPALRPGVHDLYPHVSDWISSFPDLTERGGNRIFDRGYHSSAGGFSIFQRAGRPFSLIEFTGKGVDELRSAGVLKNIVKQYHERFTRLDMAVDFETDVTPRAFATCRRGKRFEHYNDIHSETGDTYYVGSQNSERFCRVYRYNEPHPRSHLLRVEFVMKSEFAKNFGYMLTQKKVSPLVDSLMQTFGFEHPLAQRSETTKKIRSVPRAGGKGGTERWLFSQVLPACEKLIREGNHEVIDIFGKKLYSILINHLAAEENKLATQNLRSYPDRALEDIV